MTQQTILFVKSDHHVKRHQRHNKRGTVWSVVDHSARDKESTPLNRKHPVPMPKHVFDALGIPYGKVVADYDRLYRKHPEYFSSPSKARASVEYTLDNPDLAIPATKDGYTLIVRKGTTDRVVCVEFKKVQGAYRVRSTYFLKEGQLRHKLNELTQRQGGAPTFLARTGEGGISRSLDDEPRGSSQLSPLKSIDQADNFIKSLFESGAGLLTKAEQLALFAVPVHVAGSTDKHGHYRAPHIAMRKKKMATPVQASLFGEDGQPVGPKSPKLDKFLAKHGGPARMAETLKDQTPEARAKLIDAMAHLDGLDTKAVMDKIGAIATSKPVARQETTQAEPTKGIESIDIRAFLDRIDGKTPLPDLPEDGAHAEGDKWVMPLSEAVAEHKELVQTLESPGKDDDNEAIKEQGAELERMEAAQAGDTVNTSSVVEKTPAEMGHDEFYRYVGTFAPKFGSPGFFVGRDEDKETYMPKEHETFTIGGVGYQWWIGGGGKIKGRSMGMKNPRLFVTADGKRIAEIVLRNEQGSEDSAFKSALNAIHKDQKNRSAINLTGREPKEGDTKTEDGIEYRLQDGRWHRVTPEETAQDEPAAQAEPAHNIVEHVTAKGKILRGIVRTDLSRDEAKAIDEFTFRKDDGWFIREKHIAASAAVPERTSEQVAEAQEDAENKAIAARVAQAAKLRDAAAKLIAKADEEIGRDRKTNTHRRAGMAASIIGRAERERAIGATMGNLADAIESGEANHLAGVTTKAAIETLERALESAMYERDRGLSYVEQERRKGRPPEPEDIKLAKLGRISHDSPEWYVSDVQARNARLAKIGIHTDLDLRMALAEYAMFRSGARKADPIKEAERALIGMKIPGYFPTPASVVSRMIDIAGIQPGMRVLEPSAGKGNIADAVRAAGVAPDVVESSSTLRAILEAKGYSLAGHDFMDIEAKPIYDAVVMNPPFENGQDGEHVQRAYQFLKPGGTLVAVMSAGTFFRSDKKATGFRDWLGEVGGESEALPAGTFMESERQTGTSTYLVTIRKAESATADDHRSAAELAEDKADLAEALRYAPDAAETKELIGKVHAAEQAGPKEGDQKVEDGVSYTLRDGRWHRDEEPGITPDTIDRTKAMLALHSKIEELGGKDKMAEIFRGAKRDDRMKMQAEEILRKFGESLGMSRDETLAEFGLKETVREKSSTPVPKDTAPVNQGGAFDDLDPSSPTYRYRDTGYIAGSRKEDASNAIKAAAARGEQNTYTSIDWEELEKNPRQAKEVITKSNLFGKVDWDRLKEGGMTPAAGFLVDRVYAAIGQEPGEDTPRARQDYTLGLESLRARLEKCLTPDDVTNVLSELQEEYDGVVLNAEETAKYQELRGISGPILAKNRALQEEKDALSHALVQAHRKVSDARYKQDRRIRRGWKPDPELAKEIESAQPDIDAAGKALDEWKAAHPEMEDKRREHGNGWTSYSNDIVFEARKIGDSMKVIVEGAKLRNKIDNPLHRAWTLMGERFYGVLHFRRSKGSDAFAKHVAAAKAGTITDWSWAEKTVTRSPKASQESARFQLKVADNYERVGGRTVNADSTATIKAMFNLRDVQSGNWVLRDVNAAKFHVEQTAGAFSDLADLIGLPDDFVSLNGRLAMAFGARGTGAKGWAESAPRAHYEPVQRVINLTKNGGGGCLGHEWFHSLDNMIKEVAGFGNSGKDDFATVDPGMLLDSDMARAVDGLKRAMTEGPHRRTQSIKYSDKDYRLAKYNLENASGQFQRGIRDASDLEAALDHVERQFAGKADRKSQSRLKQWRTLAAAWHGGQPGGGEAKAKAGRTMSSFAYEAIDLDKGEASKYWSRTEELSARAFQSWCEDRLEGMGRKNDYLSAYADNKYHVDPLFGIEWKPYPEGEERQRINVAFDNLFDVLRRKREMLKAMMVLS